MSVVVLIGFIISKEDKLNEEFSKLDNTYGDILDRSFPLLLEYKTPACTVLVSTLDKFERFPLNALEKLTEFFIFATILQLNVSNVLLSSKAFLLTNT